MDFQRLVKDGDNMSQEFSQLSVQDYVNVALPKMQKSIEAAVSNFSGTSFPTENLFTGQLCFNTSTNCLYALVDATAATKNWVCIADLTRNIANADTAKKLAKTFNIKLTGAVTGNVDVDGSAAVTLETAANNATTIEAKEGTNTDKTMTPATTKAVVEAMKTSIDEEIEAIPSASSTAKGLVQVGNGLTMTKGILSADDQTGNCIKKNSSAHLVLPDGSELWVE